MASKMITLNVGGKIYTTSIETLTRYPDSMLGTMFRAQHGNIGGRLDPSNKDEHGRFVIDRDGPMFRHVLNFLRESSLTLPEDFKELNLLRREADFYQIEPLIEAVDKFVGDAVDMIEPKSSCLMEWVKVVFSRADHSWTIMGKQEVLDKIKKQRRKKSYMYADEMWDLRFAPRDVSIAVKLIDVVLETILCKNAEPENDVSDDLLCPLNNFGFVRFCFTPTGLYEQFFLYVEPSH